jgi:class 3 adenylate cyclase
MLVTPPPSVPSVESLGVDSLLNRLSDTEGARLRSLQSTCILDTPPEPAFDDLSALAADICGCPASYISFIDDTRQFIKSLMNLPFSMCDLPRSGAICNTTICHGDVLMVPDLRLDERFREASIVRGDPHLRFYCGAPLIDHQGHALGSLCVVDFEPRELSEEKRINLRRLSAQVVTQLEMRRLIETARSAQSELTAQKKIVDRLLLNVLPSAVAHELKALGEGQLPPPRYYPSATVLFADIKGFTKLAEGMDPDTLLHTLDEFFGAFDEIAKHYRLEPIKTIGDCYMCAGGLPESNRSHPVDAALAALAMQSFAARLNAQRAKLRLPPWEIRIGIHTGPVIAGVVGRQRFTYDVWGNAVNVAARMEQCGEAGRINISGATHAHINAHFLCQSRGQIEAKNKGPMEMFFLERLKPETAEHPEKLMLSDSMISPG